MCISKSALSVQQDFYAKVVAANLTALMAMGTQKTITRKTKGLKLKYKINFAQAISKMKHKVIYLILHAHNDIRRLIEKTIDYVSKTIEAVRDGRSAPRRLKNIKNDIHFPYWHWIRPRCMKVFMQRDNDYHAVIKALLPQYQVITPERFSRQ